MAITIAGFNFTSVNLEQDKETGCFKLTGRYELISSNGMVIAKQSFNGYQDVKLELSSESLKAQAKFLETIKTDLAITLGLN